MNIIVDYSTGNVGSIANMLKAIGVQAVISSKTEDLERATKIILPGVGAFDAAMTSLHQSGLLPVLNQRVLTDKVPILGVCLGMQLFCESSEEGVLPGLGWIPGKVVRFTGVGAERLPHMGWTNLTSCRSEGFLHDFDRDSRFYFVHSYHPVCELPEHSAASAFYGYEFTAALQRGNIMGTQFHPEKSHRFGKSLMQRFIEMN